LRAQPISQKKMKQDFLSDGRDHRFAPFKKVKHLLTSL
jgi:hypothetical protein